MYVVAVNNDLSFEGDVWEKKTLLDSCSERFNKACEAEGISAHASILDVAGEDNLLLCVDGDDASSEKHDEIVRVLKAELLSSFYIAHEDECPQRTVGFDGLKLNGLHTTLALQERLIDADVILVNP